ncbi:MAG TPA: 2-succinyl-6-hydroxy-2,4-cyclohexadiene-1-carboxylate synthase [Longimicrobiales bacterium]|nr:2-succinyl-6-hydroxy-2,4-cyclohexadiene-1-carboxylate synthase [Longimicrobiales bacterium]
MDAPTRPGAPGAAAHAVLLHGFTGSGAAWGDAVVEGLAAAGHVPVLVDLPGHGRRAGERDPACFTLEAALRDVAAAGRWPADLVGYSMGARLALHFAAAHPERVRRLVLESGSPGLATEEERRERRARDAELARFALEHGMDAFLERWEAQPLFESRACIDPRARARQRELKLRNAPASLAAALEGLGTGALPSLWDRLGEIRAPTLLLVGALDCKYVAIARRMAAALPDARVVEVPDAGHTVHLERPGAWVAAVVDFLREP